MTLCCPVRVVAGIRDAAATFMERWGVPSGGDWALYMGAALHLHGAVGTRIEGCTFSRLDNNAIILTGFDRNVSIINNTASWLGMNFAAAWGDTQDYDATDGNQPRATTLSGNLVGELGIWEKQSSFWFQAKSCQNVLKDNVVFNLPRAAINFNDGLGGGTVVDGNVIWNTCRESGDHGPLNSWSRLPFLTNLRYGVYGNFNAVFDRDFGGHLSSAPPRKRRVMHTTWVDAHFCCMGACNPMFVPNSRLQALVRAANERDHPELHIRRLWRLAEL